jgi:hypothetical protein
MDDPVYVFLTGAALLALSYKAWQASMEARETANRIARATCWRDAAGKRRLLRTYTFDYTADGFARASGFIVLWGLQLEAVGL